MNRWVVAALAALLTGCLHTVFGVDPEATLATARLAGIAAHRLVGNDSMPAPRESYRPDPAQQAHDAPILAEGRRLTQLALDAARAGDCHSVAAIRHEVLALPEVALDGGVHDVLFLRHPEIVRCLRVDAHSSAAR